MNLSGRVVLLVEDEPLIAMSLEDMLIDMGAEPHCAGGLEEGEAMIGRRRFDAAILDVNLHGHESYPLARMLMAAGVPFVFATGYGSTRHPPEFESVATLRKPYGMADVARAFLPL